MSRDIFRVEIEAAMKTPVNAKHLAQLVKLHAAFLKYGNSSNKKEYRKFTRLYSRAEL